MTAPSAAHESRRLPLLHRIWRWVATIAAAAGTAYALDLVATTAGLLLVASGLLAGIAYETALALLFGTYVIWGSSMWAMLRANWELLLRTGASTNIAAKAAFDFAARCNLGGRWQRVLTDMAYLASELVKEAPYYIGAAGAALFTDTITAIDAIIFIAGANLGAAAYGFAFAHGMRLFVRWRAQVKF